MLKINFFFSTQNLCEFGNLKTKAAIIFLHYPKNEHNGSVISIQHYKKCMIIIALFNDIVHLEVLYRKIFISCYWLSVILYERFK